MIQEVHSLQLQRCKQIAAMVIMASSTSLLQQLSYLLARVWQVKMLCLILQGNSSMHALQHRVGLQKSHLISPKVGKRIMRS